MTELPSETALGYRVPAVRQFSIFLENRVGRLLEVLRAFDEAVDVELHSIAVMEASDYAVVRTIPDNADAARLLLRESELTFSETDLLVVETSSDRQLSLLCQHLLGAEINILFMYPIMTDNPLAGGPRIALCVDENEFAGQILLRKGYRLYGAEDLR
ncbi:MAG: acetolactate synthase [Planctomycetota bacterium]|nr:acetolactate synthase [Planctomycetota bacterium]